MPHTILMMGLTEESMDSSRQVLEAEGKTVLLETDFEHSLQTIRERKIDLYMLDIEVVRSLGFDVHHRIQETDPDCPFVTVAFQSPAYRPSFFPEEAGFDGVGPPGAPRLTGSAP